MVTKKLPDYAHRDLAYTLLPAITGATAVLRYKQAPESHTVSGSYFLKLFIHAENYDGFRVGI
jgi:hypothetical protein